MNRRNNIVVIGGGLGGLSSAIYLASKGIAVTLYEQNEILGGKMNEFRRNGFRFDTGPSLMTMPFVLEDVFATAGARSENYLQLLPLKSLCRYFFPDGSMLDTGKNIDEMAAAISQWSEAEADGFMRFMAYSRRIYELTAPIFLFAPIHEIRKIARWQNVPALWSLPAIDPFRTVHQGVSRFFRDARLVQLFDRYATYNGSDPFRAPATLNIIPYVEYGLGGFYFAGGMYRLVEALERLATELGVVIHKGCKVEKILHDGCRLKGIIVAGEKIAASHIICNADVVTTHTNLLEMKDPTKRRMARLEPSLSGVVFLWGMKKKYPLLQQHNIFFSADYAKEFREIFAEKKVPTQPTVYIAITSRTDAIDAPPHGENWFVLVNAPYLSPGQDWSTMINRLRQTVLDLLKAHGLDVNQEIICESVITPEDFQRLYGSNRGSIYGISSNSRSTAFRRPGNRSRRFQGLFFAGGSCHPGGGIPLVLLSGKMAAELLLESL